MVVMMLAAATAWAAPAAPAKPAPGPTAPPPAERPPATAPAAVPSAAPDRAPAPPPAPEGTRPRAGIEDLKTLYTEAPLVAQFQVESVQGRPEVDPRLPWEVRAPILETFKGNLLPGRITVHVDSIVRAFDMKRDEIEGKQFVAALRPMGGATERRFQLVGSSAFAADSPEAEALRKLAEADTSRGAGQAAGLDLVVRPLEKVFTADGPKVIEVRLTNSGASSATYLQQPILERDGKLYLTGQGMIRIRDTTGRIVPDKGTIAAGQAPPPPKPALILPKASFVETVDLAKHFQLSEGRYTLMVALAAPDGRDRITSNGLSFQVGAVNLPEPAPLTPVPKPATPAEAPGPAPAAEKPTVERNPPGPVEKPAVDLPEPAKYTPGKASGGLSGLLRPSKARYAMGDPIELEFRLINQGPRTLAVDARLERTLALQVQSVGESPQPLTIRQVIPWPPDGSGMPEERAYLREGAFWGRTINLNTLYGKSLEELPVPTPEEIAAGKALTYERFGRNLFGFPKPGVYKVTATYAVSRTHPGEGAAPETSKEWWIGELVTNTITIQVTEPGTKP